MAILAVAAGTCPSGTATRPCDEQGQLDPFRSGRAGGQVALCPLILCYLGNRERATFEEQEETTQEGMVETYIILGKYTHQGIAKIKDGPARIEAARKAMEAAGGKMIAWYLTMGRYDFVVISQAPNVKAAAAVLLATGAQGNVSTETLHALTEAEFKEVTSSLP